MVRQSSSHRRSYAEGLVNTAEIVVTKVERDGMDQVVNFLENAFVKRVKRRVLAQFAN